MQDQRHEERLPPVFETTEVDTASSMEPIMATLKSSKIHAINTTVFAPDRFHVPAAPLSDHYGIVAHFKISAMPPPYCHAAVG